jgi:hypothetical protein
VCTDDAHRELWSWRNPNRTDARISGVISVTGTTLMQRVVDEAEYVLAVLRRMLKQVTANPQLFAPHAQQEIESTFGQCVLCKKKINVKRLEAVPWGTLLY